MAYEVLTGNKISVALLFQPHLRPLWLALMLAVPFGPLLAWKRGRSGGAVQRLMAAGTWR